MRSFGSRRRTSSEFELTSASGAARWQPTDQPHGESCALGDDLPCPGRPDRTPPSRSLADHHRGHPRALDRSLSRSTPRSLTVRGFRGLTSSRTAGEPEVPDVEAPESGGEGAESADVGRWTTCSATPSWALSDGQAHEFSAVVEAVCVLLCLPRLCSFGNDVQGAVYGRKPSGRHCSRRLNPVSHGAVPVRTTTGVAPGTLRRRQRVATSSTTIVGWPRSIAALKDCNASACPPAGPSADTGGGPRQQLAEPR